MLFKLCNELVQDVGRGRICFVHGVVYVTHSLYGRLDLLHHQLDAMMGRDFSVREFLEFCLRGDHAWPAVWRNMKCTHTFGYSICADTGHSHDFVERQVKVSKIRPYDIPVRLFSHQLQRDEVN